MPITVAILTISDRCSQGSADDTSGPALAAIAKQHLDAKIAITACVPDEVELIAVTIRGWATETPRPDLILTTGGTGLSPRDVTPEATASILQRRHPGLLELARLRCYPQTPRAFLSRGEAGTLGRTLVINLPGSRQACTEFLQAMLDILPHAIQTLRGEAADHGRSGG